MPTLAPIAGCTQVTLAPEPCAPTWPTDPAGLGPVAVGARGVIPRTDPPFTSTHWVLRAGMTNPGGGVIPTRHWIEFKGYTYLVYQGQYVNVAGVNRWVGIIARTADGLIWTTSFDGRGEGGGQYGYRMPGMLWVRGDWLYCVIYQGGSHYVQPWAYLAAGEIAVWRTSNGILWEKHQVLVSWPAAGTGQNVGGSASDCRFRGHAQTVWRAKGSGPAGETADWLVVSYMGYANVPGAPVSYHGAPQYRSLDDGETWTFVRDMQTAFPYNTYSGELGPDQIFPVPRDGHATDRWQMMAPNGPLYSDDSGTTWNWSSNPYGVWPGGGLMVDSGGLVYTRTGGMTTGPSLWVSCDYASSMTMPPGVPGGTAGGVLYILPFPASVAGGEEMIAVTGQGAHLWHSTNGGETWADRGAVPVGFFVNYGLARAPNGRILLFVIGGGGASMDLWTCDDEPTGIATPRSICPFEVDIGAPVGPIAGCASLTFITELCAALPPPPLGPGYETCAAPLGLFVLGENCLGPLEVSPTAARRVPRRWSHAHAQ